MLKIGGFQKFTLIDYPEKVASIVFTEGCNFRCGYCHNPSLVLRTSNDTWTERKVLDFLESRASKMEGVVITGGEPTIHYELPAFIEKLKNLDFCVKLDTNGTNPRMLKHLLKSSLIDYIAMDIKAPLELYPTITGYSADMRDLRESIEIVKSLKAKGEFRTTVVKTQLSIEHFHEIGKLLENCEQYYLQPVVPYITLNPKFKNASSYTPGEFSGILTILKTYGIKKVEVR